MTSYRDMRIYGVEEMASLLREVDRISAVMCVS